MKDFNEIEQYVLGLMSDANASAFERRMIDDSELAEEVELEKITFFLAQEDVKKELLEDVKNNLATKKSETTTSSNLRSNRPKKILLGLFILGFLFSIFRFACVRESKKGIGSASKKTILEESKQKESTNLNETSTTNDQKKQVVIKKILKVQPDQPQYNVKNTIIIASDSLSEQLIKTDSIKEIPIAQMPPPVINHLPNNNHFKPDLDSTWAIQLIAINGNDINDSTKNEIVIPELVFEDIFIKKFSYRNNDLVITINGKEQVIKVSEETEFYGINNDTPTRLILSKTRRKRGPRFYDSEPLGLFLNKTRSKEDLYHPSQLKERTSILPASKFKKGVGINKLYYEIIGNTFLAKKVETNISIDYPVVISGLYEGMHEGTAIIDGYPVMLKPNVFLTGEYRPLKKTICRCSGLKVPRFDDSLIPPGKFYIEVSGSINGRGIISADEAILCRNEFREAEINLLTTTNEIITDNTLPASMILPPLSNPNIMSLRKGDIKVGGYNYPLSDNIELRGYVNEVGNSIIPDYLRKNKLDTSLIDYRFYVIDDSIPNTLAFPNGMIFVNTGLLDLIENEAQLAVVLGREVAYLTHDYGLAYNDELNHLLNSVLLMSSNLTKGIHKQEHEEHSARFPLEIRDKLMYILHEIQPKSLSVVFEPTAKMESQADRVGLNYAYNAGYDIREIDQFWKKLHTRNNTTSNQRNYTLTMVNHLKSNRLDINVNGGGELELNHMEALAKLLLENIYISNEKISSRISSAEELLRTVYQNADWSNKKTGQKRYLEIVRK